MSFRVNSILVSYGNILTIWGIRISPLIYVLFIPVSQPTLFLHGRGLIQIGKKKSSGFLKRPQKFGLLLHFYLTLVLNLKNFSGQCGKSNEIKYAMISCHFHKNVNIKLSNLFTVSLAILKCCIFKLHLYSKLLICTNF